VAELFGTEHHEIVVKPDVVGLLPRLLWHMDEPIADSAFLTTYLVSEFAHRDVTVILSGVGGDELFGGYRRYLGNHYAERFERLPGWLKQGARAVGRVLPSDRHSAALNVMRLAKGFLASSALSFEERYRAYLQLMPAQLARHLLHVTPAQPWDAIHAAFASAGGEDALNRMLVVDGLTQLPDDLLMLTDKMSMADVAGMPRPLLDHELVGTGRRHAAAHQGARRAPQARHETGSRRSIAAGHPGSARSGGSAPPSAPGSRASWRACWTRAEPRALAHRGLFEPAAVAQLVAALAPIARTTPTRSWR